MKVAVALSGGGARCAAQLGYLYELQKLLEPHAYAGSSGGAIAAALLARGYSPKEALEIVESIDYSKIKLRLRGAVFDSNPMKEELQKAGLETFSGLKKPLFVTLTGYKELSVRYVNKGDLASALLASSALVPLFAPIEFEGNLYMDGGFSDNLPVTPLKEHPFILAINVNPKRVPYPNTLWGNFKRAGYALLNSNIRYSQTKANFYKEIVACGEYGILEKKKLKEIFVKGQEAAQKELKMWEEICSKNS